MCGIVGIFDAARREPIRESTVRAMADAIAHRGPDGEGFHFAPGIALGHRRLSIIDLAGGAQPMWDEGRRFCIVFNGEIYNFRALAEELRARGARFRTNSDTEVILEGWRHWGEGALGRINGMFAFALWDAHDETLFIARDRLGKKPLYYAMPQPTRLVFASELKALVKTGLISTEIAADSVEDYLTLGYVPDPKTRDCWSKVPFPRHKLMPGLPQGKWTVG